MRRLRLAPFALLALGLLIGLTASRPARAEAPPRRLVYTRGPGAEVCPTEDDLRGRIIAHLGYDAFAAGTAAPVEQVIVTMEQRETRLIARIERRDAKGAAAGKRELASAAGDCGELSSAAAFAVAFAVDPLNAHEVPAAPVITAPPPPPAISAPAAPREERIIPRAPAPPPRFRIGVAVLGAVGSEPSLTGGGSALVGIAWRRWSLDLEGRGDLSASRDAGNGAAVHASVLAGSLVPCAAFGVLRGCAVGSLGMLRGSSSGIASAAQADSVWAAVGLRGGIELPASRSVLLRAFVEPVAVLTRTSLVVDNRAVWTSPTLAGTLAIGAVVELP